MADKLFKTRELKLLEKLAQAYWFNPNSWLLDEISFTDETVTVIRKNGDTFKSELKNVKTTFAQDLYGRREIVMKAQNSKTRFKEIPGMLTDEEWNEVISLLHPSISGIGVLNEVLKMAVGKLK